MNTIEEFEEYNRVIQLRGKRKLIGKFRTGFSFWVTKLYRGFGLNGSLAKADTNRFLNIGAGYTKFEGCSNADLFPDPFHLLKDLSLLKEKKYVLNIINTDSKLKKNWEGIIISHVIEHLPPGLVIEALENIKNYLAVGGSIRILVPDYRKYCSPLVEKSPQGFNSNTMSLNRLFYSWGHQFMYDFEIFKELLLKAGFEDIEEVHFGEGRLSEFDSQQREFESLCLTATKP